MVERYELFVRVGYTLTNTSKSIINWHFWLTDVRCYEVLSTYNEFTHLKQIFYIYFISIFCIRNGVFQQLSDHAPSVYLWSVMANRKCTHAHWRQCEMAQYDSTNSTTVNAAFVVQYQNKEFSAFSTRKNYPKYVSSRIKPSKTTCSPRSTKSPMGLSADIVSSWVSSSCVWSAYVQEQVKQNL